VFEQSLIENAAQKPWNFVASFATELLIVSLALLVPLLYRDHLPPIHWKDIVFAPPPAPAPVGVQPAHTQTARTSLAPAAHRIFIFNPDTHARPAQPTSATFTPDAPPSLGVPGMPDGLGGANRTFGTFLPNAVAPPPPPPTHVDKHQPPRPVPVGGDVQMAKVIRKVLPEYPPLARSARISGVVRLIGIIAKDGTIQNLQLVSGHPLLARAAMDAVRQWVYKPTLLNGMPVEVIAPIEVRFSLGQ
jgi:periplasmic protein TonB